jgi:hypothetical protein
VYGGTWLHIFGDSLGLMVVFKCSMVTSSVWGNIATYFFGDSLGLMVVFKCSMMTSSVWGNIATYFWGLLGMDGCIQMFGGVRTWLLLFVFPLFAYHI